jgi:hypothetical protein
MGVMTITAFIFALNLSRKISPREIKIFLTKLMKKDSIALEKYLFHFKNLHPQTYERYIKKEYEEITKSGL